MSTWMWTRILRPVRFAGLLCWKHCSLVCCKRKTLFVSLVYCAESTVRWFVVREKHCSFRWFIVLKALFASLLWEKNTAGWLWLQNVDMDEI
jgi:hypothetical protein